MSESPLLGLPLLESSQAQKHVTHNEALLLLDAAIQLSVASRTIAVPPAAPADGDRYLVGGTPSGVWAGHAGELAFREASSWRFAAPRTGWRLWAEDEAKFLLFDGTVWRDLQDIDELANMSLLGVNTTADTGNRLAVASPAVLFTHAGTDQRLKINKQAAANTGSLLFQTNFSARAEMGLAGDDDFRIKVSANGSSWNEAIGINRATGAVSFPNTPPGAIGDGDKGDITVSGAGAVWTFSDATPAGRAMLNAANAAAQQGLLDPNISVVYGVTGDGVTDDAAAFTAMVAAVGDGETARILPGSHVLGSNVSQTTKRLWWETDFGFVIDQTSADRLFRDAVKPGDSSAPPKAARSIIGGSNAPGAGFGEYLSWRVEDTGAVASYQKTLSYLTAVTEDASTGVGNGGSGADVNKDIVAFDARGIIASGNMAGRAFGGNFWGKVPAGAEGRVTGIEIDISNAASAVSDPQAAFAKNGMKIVSVEGAGTEALRFGKSTTGLGWYKGLWMDPADLISDAATRFIELDGKFEVDRDGMTLIGKGASSLSADGIEIDPSGELRIGQTAAQPVIQMNRAGTPVAPQTLANVNFQGRNDAGTNFNFAQIKATASDVAATSEDGTLTLSTMIGGTLAQRLLVGDGVAVGSPTGSLKGNGTVNAVGYYINGTNLTALLDAKLDDSQATGFGLALLDDADAAAGRATLGLGTIVTVNTDGVAANVLRGDGTWGTISTATIPNNAVNNAKMNDMAASTIKGRVTASTGDPEDLTGTQTTTLLDVFTSGLKGLAPASGGGTTNYLRADGTFAAPPGGGGGDVITINGAAVADADFDDATPAAPSGKLNVAWAKDASSPANISAAYEEFIKRISGPSGAAGAWQTWQTLSADAAAITVTTPTVVMTTTGVGAGTWSFKFAIRYHSAATTTGIGTSINHTGTVSAFVSQSSFISTGGAAATGVADQVAATNAGQLMEGKSERAINTQSSALAGVDTINADMLLILEGIVVVTASGSLELKVSTEVASSGITVKAGSLLELKKIG